MNRGLKQLVGGMATIILFVSSLAGAQSIWLNGGNARVYRH